MAKTRGTGLLMVWTDIDPEHEAEFNRFYNEEHMARLAQVPGFPSGGRYVALRGGPNYSLAQPNHHAPHHLFPVTDRIANTQAMIPLAIKQDCKEIVRDHYFDDVEYGFNFSPIDHSGKILHPGGSQMNLADAVSTWLVPRLLAEALVSGICAMNAMTP